MESFILCGKHYFMMDDGHFLTAVPHRRRGSIDPQLALHNARLVFDRTMADKHPGFGGPGMAKFITVQHLLANYIGPHRHHNLAPKALKRLQAIVATW